MDAKAFEVISGIVVKLARARPDTAAQQILRDAQVIRALGLALRSVAVSRYNGKCTNYDAGCEQQLLKTRVKDIMASYPSLNFQIDLDPRKVVLQINETEVA